MIDTATDQFKVEGDYANFGVNKISYFYEENGALHWRLCPKGEVPFRTCGSLTLRIPMTAVRAFLRTPSNSKFLTKNTTEQKIIEDALVYEKDKAQIIAEMKKHREYIEYVCSNFFKGDKKCGDES
ncbi:MAG: hypothetical protein KA715_07640 [Xanthomonadaceae bacterium]|nr:hypothetical protein [Xanthomonadaceae bacterium]